MSTSRLARAAIVAVLAVGLLPVAGARSAPRAPEPAVTCSACLIVDDAGRALYGRGAQALRPNASTTKMTTALIAAEAAGATELVAVSATAEATPGGGLELHAGEIFSVEALLNALLLTSSNDAAVALAEHVAGSEPSFVELMNDYVASIGALDTHYVTAHGLDMPGHGSSARDLALIAAELLAVPELARIVARTDAIVHTPAGTARLENRNVLLESYPGATGVKTGFTADAGNVLVASAERDGRRLIVVAMDSVDAAADAAALLDLGWKLLGRTVLLARGSEVGALVFEHGTTEVRSARGVRGAARRSAVTVDFIPDMGVRMPVKAGDVVGRIVVASPAGEIDTVDAVASDAIEPAATSWAVDIFAGLLRAVGSVVGEP